MTNTLSCTRQVKGTPLAKLVQDGDWFFPTRCMSTMYFMGQHCEVVWRLHVQENAFR
jgi:hypothetical protein